MDFNGKSDQKKVFQEIARVLKPGGKFHLWDVDLGEIPETDIFLLYTCGTASEANLRLLAMVCAGSKSHGE